MEKGKTKVKLLDHQSAIDDLGVLMKFQNELSQMKLKYLNSSNRNSGEISSWISNRVTISSAAKEFTENQVRSMADLEGESFDLDEFLDAICSE